MLDDLISPYYQDQLVAKHAQGVWGDKGHTHANRIRTFAQVLKARHILDYGCGRGTLAPALQDFNVREYDPGIPGKDALPEPADLVVCTDVLEHIEPDKLTAVLQHIADLSIMGTYLVVWCKAAREKLPDGRNAHLIVNSPIWWVNRIRRVFKPQWEEHRVTRGGREVILQMIAV